MQRNLVSQSASRISILILTFLLMTFMATHAALASSPCEAEYQATLAELAEEHLDRGSQQKIRSHIQNAWRMADRNNSDAALQQLDVALEQLAGSPTKRMPAGSRERLTERIISLRTCLARGSSGRATLVITTAYFAEGIEPQPTGAGVHLRVDGETLGKTDESSSARLTVPAGTIEITGIVPSSAIGSERLTLEPGEWRELTLLLDDTKEVTEPNPLVLHQLSEGVISASFDAFVLSFAGESGAQPLQGIDYIHIEHPKGGMPVRIDHLFTLSDSSEMVAHDLEQLRGLLAQQPHGPITILAKAYDEEGFTYANAVQFYLGRHRIVGQLVAPPSFPGLDPSDIEITINVLGTDLSFTRVTDAAGQFSVDDVPIGNVGFDSSTFQDERYFYGQGNIFLQGDRSVTITMRNVEDIKNNVPPLTQSPLGFGIMSVPEQEPAERLRREELHDQHQRDRPMEVMGLQALSQSVSVSATAGSQNFPVTRSATLSVPEGTKEIVLTYNVRTAEYPYYVLSQSIYNDVWSLSVFSPNGQQLFDISRNVNAQLYIAPIWQPNGSTGDIKVTLDVSHLTEEGAAEITTTAMAMNIGDSLLPTSVDATLDTRPAFQINTVTPDTIQPTSEHPEYSTNGNSEYYSIPRPGASNHYPRKFLLDLTMPEGATVTNVRAELLSGSTTLMSLLDEGLGENVELIEDTLNVRVTMHDFVSQVGSQPPPAHEIAYRFQVAVEVDGMGQSDIKTSAPRISLWRMPDGFERYSIRDVGGDDWASRGAYNWLEQNRGLITRINDISGEHSRNIGHTGHLHGADIDIFHYYRFPGAWSGGNNHDRLRQAVQAAIQGDSAAREQVVAWAVASRDGIEPLLTMHSVRLLFYSIGTPLTVDMGEQNHTLARGWARDLILDGIVQTDAGAELELGIGEWAYRDNGKLRFDATHHSHLHISLNRSVIN